MMKSISPLLDTNSYSSLVWHDSSTFEGVRFGTRRVSLAQRIGLTRQIRELTLRNEFLRAGETADQLEAALGELLCRQLYLQWGLVEIEGMTIDGSPATPELLIEKGPESLSEEIASSILADMRLSEKETKNF